MEEGPTDAQDMVDPEPVSTVDRSMLRRVGEIILGVILVIVGIILSGPGIPGPGLLTIVFGLNLIKPDNRVSRWVRRKAPGIPDEGPIPARQIVIVGLITVAFVVISVLFGAMIFEWFRNLVGL